MSKFTCLTAAIMIACASAGVARAEDNTPKTRAEVLAEIHAARQSGELYAMGAEDGGSFWMSQQPWRSTLTRAQVRAELAAACAAGECTAMSEGDAGPRRSAAAANASTLTRAEVIAEMLRDKARGERLAVYSESGDTPVLARPRVPAVLYTGPNLARGRETADAQPATAG